MEESFVSLEVDAAATAWLWLDRPDVHNAFDDQLITALNRHLSDLREKAADGAVRAVVLGSRGKHFSAGADLGWMQRMVDYDLEANLADSRELARLMAQLNSLSCPVIARVQGAAFGGAVGLVACCDIAMASEKSRFCLSEVRIGLSPAVISPYVQAAIGPRQMRRYALTAETLESTRAREVGLVHEVVAHEALDEAIAELIQAIGRGSPQAQRETKALLGRIEQTLDPEAREADTCQVITAIRVSDEGQEGLASFFEKRSPAWVAPGPVDATEQRS